MLSISRQAADSMRFFFWKEKLRQTCADINIHLNQKHGNRKIVCISELMEFSNVCPKGDLIVNQEQKTQERKKTKERKNSKTEQSILLQKTTPRARMAGVCSERAFGSNPDCFVSSQLCRNVKASTCGSLLDDNYPPN